MVELGNTLKKDIWLTVPHTASDNYVSKMAEFFKTRLDPGLTIYIEYSNEVWNFMFSQAQWVDRNGPGNLNYPRKYAERAVHMFKLWEEIFGSERGRLKRVLNIQAAYPWYGREVLPHTHPQVTTLSLPPGISNLAEPARRNWINWAAPRRHPKSWIAPKRVTWSSYPTYGRTI